MYINKKGDKLPIDPHSKTFFSLFEKLNTALLSERGKGIASCDEF
jgi:hypothetical protein